MGPYTRRLLLMTLISSIPLLPMACGRPDEGDLGAELPGEPGTSSPGATIVVLIPMKAASMGDRAFGSGPLEIEAGTTVTWSNQDTVKHTVTSATGLWDSGAIEPGAAFSHRFMNRGEYPYFCNLQGMHGTIRVKGAGNPNTRPPIPIPSETPAPTPSATPRPGIPGWPPPWWPFPRETGAQPEATTTEEGSGSAEPGT